jgi:Fe-S cluster assembly ATP-binding protein
MLVVQDLSIKVDEYSPILKQLTLEYGPGVHIIMGPNGVGKSTFAHALMGNPSYQVEGGATLNNNDLLDLETYERAQAGLFVSFQNPTPIEGLSNFQFVKQCLTAKNGPISIKDNLTKFRGLSDDLGLDPSWDKKQLNLEASGGEKKKNELIQLDMLDPQVAILDEPDSGLDVDAIKVLVEKLNEFASKEGKCLIIISHYAELIKKLNPNTLTVIERSGYAKQTDNIDIAYNILENGFEDEGSKI